VEGAGRLGRRHQIGVPALGAVEGPFRYYLRVRYIECDAQKVVFNSRYGEYVDVAINEFLRAIGVLPEFIEGRLDFQLVKQTVEWKAPARFDQVLELSIAATRLGTTSFTVGTTFRIAGQERVIVTVDTVYVLVDAGTLTKLPLPDALRAALQQGAAGRVTDHAAFLERR
jgi:acyl-CoA thioester hydrolase